MFDQRAFLGQVPIRLGQPGGTGSPGGAFAGGGPSGGFGGGPSGPGGAFSGGGPSGPGGVIVGPSGPGVSPGGPSVSVPHENFTTFPLSFNNLDGWNNWWGWPYYYNYPLYRPPQTGRMVCRKLEKESEDEGRDVFECTQEQQYAAPLMTYPMLYPWYTGW